MTFSMVGAVVVLIMVAIALWGRKIVVKLIPDVIIKRYALKAVASVEFLVVLMSDVKLKTAMEWASRQLMSKWKISIPESVLERWIEWAVAEMKRTGREIKAENVLPKDHPKVLFQTDLREQIKVSVGANIKY